MISLYRRSLHHHADVRAGVSSGATPGPGWRITAGVDVRVGASLGRQREPTGTNGIRLRFLGDRMISQLRADLEVDAGLGLGARDGCNGEKEECNADAHLAARKWGVPVSCTPTRRLAKENGRRPRADRFPLTGMLSYLVEAFSTRTP